MTINIAEVEGLVVVKSAEAITTTETEAGMPAVDLADLLDQDAIAHLAARARQ